MSEQKQNLIQISEIRDDFSNITIKKYLQFSVKKLIITNNLESVVSENQNGLKIVDYSLLSMVKDYTLFNNYSNVDLSQEDVVSAFDQLKEKGILDYVLSNIPTDELNFFENIIYEEIQQIKEVENSIQGVLTKQLSKVIDKLPDEKGLSKIIKELPKQINKISPEKLQYISSAIGWVNGKEKS